MRQAIACYKANFPEANARCADIATMFESDWQAKLTLGELDLRKRVGKSTFLSAARLAKGTPI
jgi:hypothetical protein